MENDEQQIELYHTKKKRSDFLFCRLLLVPFWGNARKNYSSVLYRIVSILFLRFVFFLHLDHC